jgi:hypothetical protein
MGKTILVIILLTATVLMVAVQSAAKKPIGRDFLYVYL